MSNLLVNMIKLDNKYKFLFIVFFFLGELVQAQHVCSSQGVVVTSTVEYGVTVYSMGDHRVAYTPSTPINIPNWHLKRGADVYVTAALYVDSGAVMRVDSGARLAVYGDMLLSGTLILEKGAEFVFYGQDWINSPTAKILDGKSSINKESGGSLFFVAPRPEVPSSLNPSSCVSSTYSGGNFSQGIDGASIPFDLDIYIFNANNLSLKNTETVIEGTLTFSVDDGDIILDTNKLVFTENASYSWDIPDARGAFIVTNDTIPPDRCRAMVEKDGVQPGNYFIFPIGSQELNSLGERDFSPVYCVNLDDQIINISADVKTYAQASNLGADTSIVPPKTPLSDHLWGVQGSAPTQLGINTLHYIDTPVQDILQLFNEYRIKEIFQIDNNELLDNKGGPKGLGSGGGGTGTGIIYEFDISDDVCSNGKNWIYKPAIPIKPLFTLEEEGCDVLLSADLTQYYKSLSSASIYHSSDGLVYRHIGNMDTKDSLLYFYRDTDALQSGTNHYYLELLFGDNQNKDITDTLKITVDCGRYSLYPNPTDNSTLLSGLTENDNIIVYDEIGRVSMKIRSMGNSITLDLSTLESGIYYIQIMDNANKILGVLTCTKY